VKPFTSINSYLFSQLEAAPWFTFLWTDPIPISFYFPAFLPGLILSFVDILDTIGDVSATSEVSRVAPDGKQHMKRIKGAMLADVLATVMSGVAGGTPTNARILKT
jgi:NCS2 family nucleobase:cation symporter-2